MKPNELESAQKRLQLRIALNQTVRCQTREEQHRLIAETAGVSLIFQYLPEAAKNGEHWKSYLHGITKGLIHNIRIARGDAGKYDRILASLCDELVGALDAINLVEDFIYQLRYHPEKFQNA